MPAVSIIVPVYNTEKYLPKCLDSLTNQTLSDIEIICINDHSTDNSLKILQDYAKKDSRIKIIDFNKNRGVSVARNTGINTVTGEYIGFMDSDDFVDTDFYEKLYTKAKENNADVVKGNVYDYDISHDTSILTLFYDINDKVRENSTNFLYGFTSAIYKTDFIKQNNVHFPENITHFEDPYFSIGVTLYNPKICFVNSAKYYYVKHSESACANSKTLQKTKDFTRSIYAILDMIGTKNTSEENYHIYLSFLIQQLVPWCIDLTLSDEASIEACKCLENILSNAKFGTFNVLNAYFMRQKQTKKDALKKDKEKLLKQLRAKIARK